MTDKLYNFGEKTKERVKCSPPKKDKDGKDIFWEELDVWQTPKYLQSKEKAIEIIEKGGYGVTEGDFWILMNKGGSKMCYTGLIISHNGCLKINAKLDKEKRFRPECTDVYKDVNGDIVMRYVCPEQGLYEFGEVSPKNCKNEYPYAMALKRLQDRVVLKTSEIAFFGIYSDSESDDFKKELQDKPEDKADDKPKNNSGLSPSGELANGDDMKETLNKKNEQDFAGLKAIIESCGGEEELKQVWTSKENTKIISSLKKWRPELYDKLVAAKDYMKSEFSNDPEYKGE